MSREALPYRIEAGGPNILIRVIYFILIGWWLSGLWMALAYLLLLTIVFLPVSFWMYGRIGAVTTLYRS